MMLAATYNTIPAAPVRGRSLLLATLGVVYGDIGTSPLYALRQSLLQYGAFDQRAVLGVLSLIAWSLLLVVTVKYVLVIMRADNRGEGGLLALTALVLRTGEKASPRRQAWIIAAGMLGAALFYGDGVITPAISVLSAVEGLKVATPLFEPYVLPITLVLLVGLFAVQRRGTAKVGGFFGPVMLMWFAALAVLGVAEIARNPYVLLALNPLYALDLFASAPWAGFVALGAVFLAVTGAETLYADMGHFGRKPLKQAWLYLVCPALLLNYFGQGALVLADPRAIEHPFYHLAPDWALYPLVALASAATIIASQAVISGAFSLTRQAVQLGYLPRLEIRHTSADEIGQVYVPRINLALLVAVVLVVLIFRTSDNLGSAYGIAVTGMMAITTGLAFLGLRQVLNWSAAVAVTLFVLFLVIDVAFLSANLLKVADGGWLPIVVAAGGALVMSTWWRGRRVLDRLRDKSALPLDPFIARLGPERPPRVPGTAVFLTARLNEVPGALLHSLKHHKVLHERVVLMSLRTEDVPRIADENRIEIQRLDKGFYAVLARFGFMEEPNVAPVLSLCRRHGLAFEPMETSFFVGREKIRAARRSALAPRWRQRLFIFLSNNMQGAAEFFRIPPNRAIEVGGHVEI